MDWLQFISSVINTLAWPGTIIVFLLRNPVKELIPLLQKMKYKDFEMEFGRKLSEAREDIVLIESAESKEEISTQEKRILELAKVSPRSAVTEAWRWVEIAILDSAKNLFGNEFKNKTATFRAIHKLEFDDRIDRDVITLMKNLRGLRNDA